MHILAQALGMENADNAVALIQNALQIADGDVAGYSMPKTECWPRMDRAARAYALAEWLSNELRYAV